MTKYTAGPWKQGYNDNQCVYSDYKKVAYVECRQREWQANARLITAAPIGFDIADAILAQEADGISRKDFIVRKAFEFMKQADPETLEIYKEIIGRRIGGNK